MRLGEPVFDPQGRIHSAVRFATLAAFVWQQETGTAWRAAHARAGTPHLGTHQVQTQAQVHSDDENYNINSKLSSIHVGKQAILLTNTANHIRADLFSSYAAQDTSPPASPAAALQATAYYLLYNGILGDKRPASGNVLTHAVLDALLTLHASTPAPEAALVVYGEACRLGAARLQQANVTFKHIPYDVKAR
jgi:adenine-specific DNA-methyltransferase